MGENKQMKQKTFMIVDMIVINRLIIINPLHNTDIKLSDFLGDATLRGFFCADLVQRETSGGGMEVCLSYLYYK